jgi:hypothetical protein
MAQKFPKKSFFTLLLTFVFFSLACKFTFSEAQASVGLVELRSTNREDYRCFASSLFLPNNRYDVAINCVDLVFPISQSQNLFYIVWVTPTDGKPPARLGDLGKGLVRFESGLPFSRIFVTVEANPNTRTPGITVMTGAVVPIEYLQRPTTPTPTLEVKPTEGQDGDQEGGTSTTNLSTRDKLLLALKRAGIAAVIALVAIVGLIFVVTRSRG